MQLNDCCPRLLPVLPLQTPERFNSTLELVGEPRPDRISLFSLADLPSQEQRLAMLEQANRLLTAHG